MAHIGRIEGVYSDYTELIQRTNKIGLHILRGT